jgi:hypothetical protein
MAGGGGSPYPLPAPSGAGVLLREGGGQGLPVGEDGGFSGTGESALQKKGVLTRAVDLPHYNRTVVDPSESNGGGYLPDMVPAQGAVTP